MRNVYRLIVLALGLLPPLSFVALQELSAANLVDLCAMECNSVASGLDLLSLFAFILFTPALLILFLGTMEARESGPRTAGLVILLFSFYGWIFIPGWGLFSGGSAFVQPIAFLLPVLLVLGLGYFVVTARTPKMIVLVLLAALLLTVLLLATGYPPPGTATQYSCSETAIVNASSPIIEYANACSPYQVALSGSGFPSEYTLWVAVFAAFAALIDIVFVGSYRMAKVSTAEAH